VVTLSASAAADSTFAGWSGEGCSGTGTCQITMTQARNVTATFIVISTGGAIYHFDEGSGTIVIDSSGAGNDGTIVGASYIPGQNGTALRFGESTGDCVIVPQSVFTDFGNTAYFEAWIRLGAYPWSDYPATVFRKKALYNDWSLEVKSDGSLAATLYNAAHNDPAMAMGGYIPLNVWTKVATWYDGDALHTYVNDVEVTAQVKPMDLDWAGNYYQTEIGNSSIDGPNYRFMGDIDEVVIAAEMPSTPPEAAVLVSPSGTVSTTRPTYTWNMVPGASWYYLWVNDSSNSSGKIKMWYTAADAECSSVTGQCSVTPATALAYGQAQWWIQTWNGAGSGPWSAGMTFQVTNPVVPPPPATLISPAGTISTSTPTYIWNSVPTATWYYLWVNNNGTPRIQTWYPAAQAGCASGTGTCSVTPSTALTNGTAQWWIQTWNSAGYGPWSDGMYFAIASSNLAPNPSFEYGTDRPDGWIDETYSGTCTFAWDNATAHSGNRSLGIKNFSPGANVSWTTSQYISIDPAHDFQISAWYKNSTKFSSVAFLAIMWGDKSYALGSTGLWQMSPTSEWTYRTIVISSRVLQQAFPGVNRVKLSFGGSSNSADSGEIRIDDVSFIDISSNGSFVERFDNASDYTNNWKSSVNQGGTQLTYTAGNLRLQAARNYQYPPGITIALLTKKTFICDVDYTIELNHRADSASKLRFLGSEVSSGGWASF
jgi:hypothetical protein